MNSKFLTNAERLEAFLGSSSKDMGWKLEKYFKEIKYDKMLIRHSGLLTCG